MELTLGLKQRDHSFQPLFSDFLRAPVQYGASFFSGVGVSHSYQTEIKIRRGQEGQAPESASGYRQRLYIPLLLGEVHRPG